jgi:hypothetical protein
MAILKLGAFITALSGKIGGQSISNRSQSTTIRNITQTNTKPTVKQSKQRFQTAFISNAWQNLPQLDRDAFIAIAPSYTYKNRIGDTVSRTGFGVFNFINQNLSLVGSPLLFNSPGYTSPIKVEISIISANSSELIIQSSNTAANYLYALFCKPSLSLGRKAQRGDMLFIKNLTISELASGVDIVPFITDVFGPLTFPNNIGFFVSGIQTKTGNRAQAIDIFTQIVTD